MTTKTATVAKKTETAASEPKTLQEAVSAGTVRLLRKRKNGTVRSLPYLAPGSSQRKDAEAVAARRAKGETVNAIAEDLKVSIATARRMISNLELAQQIEAGQHSDKYSPGDTTATISTVGEAA